MCENVDADAKEVERGLRTDSRIGIKAYVSVELGFAGGTLARGTRFLESLEDDRRLGRTLLSSIIPSTQFHNDWVKRKIDGIFVGRTNLKIIVWGLTYTADMSTLRRSVMLELAIVLSRQGHRVSFYDDPKVVLPIELSAFLTRMDLLIQSIDEAEEVVVSKNMGDFGDSRAALSLMTEEDLVVLGPARHLLDFFDARVMDRRYLAVGFANEK